MAIGVIAGLQGITDEELNELALAVAAERSRRQAENLAAPEPGAEPPAATSQAGSSQVEEESPQASIQ